MPPNDTWQAIAALLGGGLSGYQSGARERREWEEELRRQQEEERQREARAALERAMFDQRTRAADLEQAQWTQDRAQRIKEWEGGMESDRLNRELRRELAQMPPQARQRAPMTPEERVSWEIGLHEQGWQPKSSLPPDYPARTGYDPSVPPPQTYGETPSGWVQTRPPGMELGGGLDVSPGTASSLISKALPWGQPLTPEFINQQGPQLVNALLGALGGAGGEAGGFTQTDIEDLAVRVVTHGEPAVAAHVQREYGPEAAAMYMPMILQRAREIEMRRVGG